jgi:hypothetical protein
VQSIITDNGAPAETVKALEERGINVIIAE